MCTIELKMTKYLSLVPSIVRVIMGQLSMQ